MGGYHNSHRAPLTERKNRTTTDFQTKGDKRIEVYKEKNEGQNEE